MRRQELLRAAAARLAPGLLLSVTVAAAASFVASHYGAPVMLFVLLIGMAFNFLHQEGPCREGVDLAAKFMLRLGVGLLEARIALDDLAWIGAEGALVLAGLVALTIASGFVIAPLLGRLWRFALMTGGGGDLRDLGRAGDCCRDPRQRQDRTQHAVHGDGRNGFIDHRYGCLSVTFGRAGVFGTSTEFPDRCHDP
jgi:hypothetical protein